MPALRDTGERQHSEVPEWGRGWAGGCLGQGGWGREGLKGAMVWPSHHSRLFVSKGAAVGWPTGQGRVDGEMVLDGCTVLGVGLWEEKLAAVPVAPWGPAHSPCSSLGTSPLLPSGSFKKYFCFPSPCLSKSETTLPQSQPWWGQRVGCTHRGKAQSTLPHSCPLRWAWLPTKPGREAVPCKSRTHLPGFHFFPWD